MAAAWSSWHHAAYGVQEKLASPPSAPALSGGGTLGTRGCQVSGFLVPMSALLHLSPTLKSSLQEIPRGQWGWGELPVHSSEGALPRGKCLLQPAQQ